MATVPDNTTFSMQDVYNVVGYTNLESCLTAPDGAFDPNYIGSKNSLLNFRNYDSSYMNYWDGYVNITFNWISGGYISFHAVNASSARYNQSKTISYEIRFSGNVVVSGSVATGNLYSPEDYSDPSDYCGYPSWEEVWANTGGGWQQIY